MTGSSNFFIPHTVNVDIFAYTCIKFRDLRKVTIRADLNSRFS